MSKYIIRITRKLPGYEMADDGGNHLHFYYGEHDGRTAYLVTDRFDRAKILTKEEVIKVIKEVELIYEKCGKANGILLKIEALDAEANKPVNMYKFETIISRFELMDL